MMKARALMRYSTSIVPHHNMPEKKQQKKPTIWVLTSGEIGMVNQAVGLAEASGYDYVQKKIILKKRYKLLPGNLAAKLAGLNLLHPQSDRLEAPYPDIIISCGRRSIAASLALKAQNPKKIFLIYIHHPRIDLALFDMVVPSYHDTIFGDHVYPTGPSMHRVTEKTLQEAREKWQFSALSRPLLAVLVGGNRRSHRMKRSLAEQAGKELLSLSKKFGIILSFSRRTPYAAWLAFMGHLHQQKNIYIWDGTGDNPYFGMLATAEAILVSAESVSMISEAISTGKPVYLLELPGRSKRFDYFHNWLYQNDYCRPFTGKIELNWGKSINDTDRIAAILREQYREFIDKN